MEMSGTIALATFENSWTRLKDFWDLTKPRMNVVVAVTTLSGFYLSAPDSIEWRRLMFTMIGTAMAAAGASVLNQLIERDFYALMPRTANRPLPA
ncbi:MAG TPA: UbiA family prenyltransferase, partial [Tepidisphaeraceae bacterium]|nr:UbiA family prenyltransferase [Tepidisphaeraceae bacterium]